MSTAMPIATAPPARIWTQDVSGHAQQKAIASNIDGYTIRLGSRRRSRSVKVRLKKTVAKNPPNRPAPNSSNARQERAKRPAAPAGSMTARHGNFSRHVGQRPPQRTTVDHG